MKLNLCLFTVMKGNTLISFKITILPAYVLGISAVSVTSPVFNLLHIPGQTTEPESYGLCGPHLCLYYITSRVCARLLGEGGGGRCRGPGSHATTTSCTMSGGQRPVCSPQHGGHHWQDTMRDPVNLSALHRNFPSPVLGPASVARLPQTTRHGLADKRHIANVMNWWISYWRQKNFWTLCFFITNYLNFWFEKETYNLPY